MKKNQYLVLLFFLAVYIQTHAQIRRWNPGDRAGSWELGLAATHLTYSGIGQRTG